MIEKCVFFQLPQLIGITRFCLIYMYRLINHLLKNQAKEKPRAKIKCFSAQPQNKTYLNILSTLFFFITFYSFSHSFCAPKIRCNFQLFRTAINNRCSKQSEKRGDLSKYSKWDPKGGNDNYQYTPLDGLYDRFDTDIKIYILWVGT